MKKSKTSRSIKNSLTLLHQKMATDILNGKLQDNKRRMKSLEGLNKHTFKINYKNNDR